MAGTREEYRKLRRAAVIPIWLRVVVLFTLIIISTVAGALVGYSVIGHGKAVDVLKGKAFFHVYDLVEKK